MSVVLAKGSSRFSGESDDYPPDIPRHTKKVSKEKKSHYSSRSADAPLVTIAEPYPKGSLLAPLLNPLHKAVYDTTVAVARAPGDLMYGITPGQKVDPSKSSRSLRDSDEDSDSEEYTESEEEDEDDEPIRAHGHGALHALAAARKAEKEALRGARKAEREALRGARRAEREALRGARKAEREARKDRKSEREKYVQGVYYGNWDAGKEKPEGSKKYKKEKESGVDVPAGRFRLVMCYWDGQREVY